MSGGSFDYLCQADTQELMGHQRTQLASMAAELESRGYKDVALDTERLLAYIEHADRQITARAERLKDVWHSVEWTCSGDTGPDAIERSVQKYRNA